MPKIIIHLFLFLILMSNLYPQEGNKNLNDISNLVNLLKETEPSKRIQGALLLGNKSSGATDSVPQLINAMYNEQNIKVRIEIIRALERIAGKANLTVPALINELKHDNPQIRWAASGALTPFGKKASLAVPALLELLEDEDESVRSSAAGTLARMGPMAANALIEICMSKNYNYLLRINAIKSLGGMGVYAVSVVPTLIRLSYDKDKVIKKETIRSLRNIIADESSPGEVGWLDDPKARIWPKASVVPQKNKEKIDTHNRLLKEIIRVMIENSNDSDKEVRFQAIKGLNQFGNNSANTLPVLIKMLEDKEPIIRRVTIQAIASYEDIDDEVISDLVSMLSDSSDQVIWASMNTLSKLGKRVVPELIDVLEYDDPYLSPLILKVIYELGKDAEASIFSIIRLLSSEDSEIRMLAAEALGGIGIDNQEVKSKLKLSSKDNNLKVREAARWALSRINKSKEVKF